VIDTAALHRDLVAGALDTDLDAGSDVDVFSLISVVDGVMREKRYLEPTARRVRIILQELLGNVGRHVPDRHAWVHVALHETHLRRAVLDVGDNGPGVPDDVLDRYTQRLLAGEREHGLLLVSRLATKLHGQPATTAWQAANHAVCELIEHQPRPSALARNKRIGLVRVDYSSPKVLWIGPEDSYTYFRLAPSIDRFVTAARRGWSPVLATYFGAVQDTSHLAVEVDGYDLSTEASPTFVENAFAAVATHFSDRIGQQRVVALAPMADPSLRGQARRAAQHHGLRWFDSEAEVAAYVAAQAPAG
jgi:anti-sigma regulatory factor (Ser/Thr protein kinase)